MRTGNIQPLTLHSQGHLICVHCSPRSSTEKKPANYFKNCSLQGTLSRWSKLTARWLWSWNLCDMYSGRSLSRVIARKRSARTKRKALGIVLDMHHPNWSAWLQNRVEIFISCISTLSWVGALQRSLKARCVVSKFRVCNGKERQGSGRMKSSWKGVKSAMDNQRN